MRAAATALTTAFLSLLGCDAATFNSGGTSEQKVPTNRIDDGGDGDSDADGGFDGQDDGTGASASDGGNDSGNDETDGPQAEGADEGADSGEIPMNEKKSLEALPKFALMSNDFKCGLCHVKIFGNLASSASVAPARGDSVGEIVGQWKLRGSLDIGDLGARIDVRSGVEENYSGRDVPANIPRVNFGDAKAKAKGSVRGVDDSGNQVVIKARHAGNLSLVGSPGKPILIQGDVFVDGDLVITGPYSGIGTIYVSGNIFVPFDLVAKSSPFPFPEDAASAASAGIAAAKKRFDGLGLATPRSIIIGYAESTVIGSPELPVNSRPAVQSLYGWMPKARYEALYGKGHNCVTGAPTQTRSLNAVDAFLYAGVSVEGFAAGTGFSIRGGMITEHFLMLNASLVCVASTTTNPVHGRAMDSSYIEYDWRLNSGEFPVLQRLGDAMK